MMSASAPPQDESLQFFNQLLGEHLRSKTLKIEIRPQPFKARAPTRRSAAFSNKLPFCFWDPFLTRNEPNYGLTPFRPNSPRGENDLRRVINPHPPFMHPTRAVK